MWWAEGEWECSLCVVLGSQLSKFYTWCHATWHFGLRRKVANHLQPRECHYCVNYFFLVDYCLASIDGSIVKKVKKNICMSSSSPSHMNTPPFHISKGAILSYCNSAVRYIFCDVCVCVLDVIIGVICVCCVRAEFLYAFLFVSWEGNLFVIIWLPNILLSTDDMHC